MPSPSIPPTMRAWVRPSRGPAAKSLKLTTLPTPTISASSDSVLVRVAYVALQWSSEGGMELFPPLPFLPPRIPEIEYSGTIVAAGSRAPAEFREPGTRVEGFRSIGAGILLGGGVLCEYVQAAPEQLVRLPESGVDMAAAAGMVGCGSTALKMIRTARLKSGDRVMINGASSSVGAVLVQMCKKRGASMVGVASGGNEELVRGLGADEFVDYTAHASLPAHLTSKYGAKPFDTVFDCAGVHALYVGSPGYLKPAGAVINVGAFAGIGATLRNWLLAAWLPTWLGGVPRRYIMFNTPPDKDSATYMAKMIEDGEVRVLVDSVWNMEDAVKAYERVASKRARGKVVIKVNGE